ncbi:eukaryotic translation initiation factor 2 [Actinidia rufa]|uniref:Eukaryotic translation initiation factor 2 n=1 Tax=Actinidia rufa TaxID=165716 RepID=A0A7J0DBH3_9ERIC|nr:eukaryotic translation initiation factor 2 [Actinidia rufa]
MALSSQTVLQFAPSPSSLSAKIHPLVIFNICDCYVRRPDQAERVIGTLLGSVFPDGTVDVRNSYAVPHNESSDQVGFSALLAFSRLTHVALDIDYHHNMLSSHLKVSPKEVIVGWNFLSPWFGTIVFARNPHQRNENLNLLNGRQEFNIRFSTGFGVTGGSALIHEFYSREVPNPVHLTIDTAFRNGEASIKAFVSVSLSLGDQQLAAQFQEIPFNLRMLEAERVGFDILKTTSVDKLPNDLEGMEASMERLLALIDDVSKYVDDVVEDRIAPDNSIGRLISDIVASIPKVLPPAFDKLVNDSLQHMMKLLYTSGRPITPALFVKHHKNATELGRKVEHSCSNSVADIDQLFHFEDVRVPRLM